MGIQHQELALLVKSSRLKVRILVVSIFSALSPKLLFAYMNLLITFASIETEDKETLKDPKSWENWKQELLDALTVDIDCMVMKIIDEGVFALDTDSESTAGPTIEQVEKHFHLDQMRVLYQNYKKESEKSIAEIRKRNEEMIWETRDCGAERIKEAMKFEKMGLMLALVDNTGRGFGDDVQNNLSAGEILAIISFGINQ
ncbi:hypothetical protein BPAE_0083g00170 [Botrytis paeoniae]|uniref:Uncharacterized protein n=1 Tax=Botrytis paeoniae TaxID=278948 RepID=A0A4Z1FU95_9HELO|nr:hypothetical protein BPAE_0083g00170 [Botrytis paeoniae]